MKRYHSFIVERLGNFMMMVKKKENICIYGPQEGEEVTEVPQVRITALSKVL
jgi:hypothetical protein